MDRLGGLESRFRGIRRQIDGGGSWVISGAGIVLAGLTLWYVIVFRALAIPAGPNQFATLLLRGLEILLLGLFSIVLVYAGYWLAASPFDDQKRWWAGLWTMVGLAGIVAIVALVQSTQLQSGEPLTAPSLVEELLIAAGGGGLAGLLIGISTVRATRSREQVKRQRDTLEFMNELLRHNVLNGMQLILGQAELLRAELEAGRIDHDEARDRLASMEARGEDVVDLVENVRTLSRSMSDDVERGPTDLSRIIHAEVATARDTYDATIETEIPEGLTVDADDLLGDVVGNLLSNAVEHGDTDHPNVRVAAERDGDRVVVTVADDGPGIPDEYKSRYLEPGEQDAASVGQGLGLYLVDTLVTSYGGDVRIEDNEPRGTVVTVELQRP
jgi:signal transduction histidine kinase